MDNFYKISFFTLIFCTLIFGGIIYQQEFDAKYSSKQKEFLEQQNLILQNTIDNLNEDIDTLKKQANKIIYVTKIKEAVRDSIFITIDSTKYADIDSCNIAVHKLFDVCKMDKEIFKLKDSAITTKDSIIYKLELQKGNYTQIIDNKNEINEHLQDELKLNKRQKIGQKITIGLLSITSLYLLFKK